MADRKAPSASKSPLKSPCYGKSGMPTDKYGKK